MVNSGIGGSTNRETLVGWFKALPTRDSALASEHKKTKQEMAKKIKNNNHLLITMKSQDKRNI
jgi:hypothetical protein